jgi:hypothetical protein
VEEAGQGLLGDEEGGQEDEDPLEDGGEVLGLGVAEGVGGIRGPCGEADGEKGQEGRHHVDRGLQGVGEEGHRAREAVGQGLEPQD